MSQTSMDQNTNAYRLSSSDLTTIRDALRQLPGDWTLLTEEGDERELYGRLIPPWGDHKRSAFLIEREGDHIILTDNISERDRCPASRFDDTRAAMQAVRVIIRG